ncbi:MAG: hypothetical protein Q8P68_05200 [Candidatus Peregrinibacteria bacterium]|nr:hypothetical protein [Candidatus Peregrinibacteria bacterium]
MKMRSNLDFPIAPERIAPKRPNASNRKLTNLVSAFSALLLSACTAVEVDSKPNEHNQAMQTNTSNYIVDEHVISLTTTFSVTKDGAEAGEIVKKIISLTPTYTYSNKDGDCLAVARRALISIGNEVDVKDCSGKELAVIHENIIKTLFGAGIKTSYRINGPDGTEIGSSVGTKFMATSFDITDANGTAAMHAKRPMINFTGDTWRITIEDTAIDTRALILLVAFKTDADNERKKEEKDIKNER